MRLGIRVGPVSAGTNIDPGESLILRQLGLAEDVLDGVVDYLDAVKEASLPRWERLHLIGKEGMEGHKPTFYRHRTLFERVMCEPDDQDRIRCECGVRLKDGKRAPSEYVAFMWIGQHLEDVDWWRYNR